MTLRQKVAAGALLVAAYLPIWVVVAALALWAIWNLFWMGRHRRNPRVGGRGRPGRNRRPVGEQAVLTTGRVK